MKKNSGFAVTFSRNESVVRISESPLVSAARLLWNHSVSNDITGQYLSLDTERTRVHMCRITSAFLDLLELNSKDDQSFSMLAHSPEEVTQLAIPFDTHSAL